MPSFTMSEFVVKHKLKVNLTDTGATKLVAKKLKELGYIRVKKRHNGIVQNVWSNDHNRLDELKSQLASLKL